MRPGMGSSWARRGSWSSSVPGPGRGCGGLRGSLAPPTLLQHPVALRTAPGAVPTGSCAHPHTPSSRSQTISNQHGGVFVFFCVSVCVCVSRTHADPHKHAHTCTRAHTHRRGLRSEQGREACLVRNRVPQPTSRRCPPIPRHRPSLASLVGHSPCSKPGRFLWSAGATLSAQLCPGPSG